MNETHIQYDIDQVKIELTEWLQSFFALHIFPHISAVNIWGNDALTRLLQTTVKGKMLRTALMVTSEQVFSPVSGRNSNTIIAAAALELIQTGLLIHDDIMDNDEKRRGMPSMHTQYADILQKRHATETEHTGQAMAMCVGDMAFFIAIQLLSNISDPDLSRTLILLYSQEIAKVCVGQMQDVYGGHTQKPFIREEILNMYAYKTGRYTCGLPLVTGAIIAGENDKTQKHLWRLGTHMGVIFQIKDDELNIFGESDKTGKPVDSDIREGKQTVYRSLLMEKSSADSKEKLLHIFGNPNISSDDIAYVKNQILTLKIDQDISAIIEQAEKNISEIIAHLLISQEKKDMLTDIISHINTRYA